jgi:DNA polymerase elongation subunit (family B)
MEGWLFDCYSDDERNRIVVWIKDEETRKLEYRYVPYFYVGGTDLTQLAKQIDGDENFKVQFERKRTAPSMKELNLLKISSSNFRMLKRLAEDIYSTGAHSSFMLYDVDVPYEQRFMIDRGIFPFARISVSGGDNIACIDSYSDLDYDMPELNVCRMNAVVSENDNGQFISEINVDDTAIRGDERHTLLETARILNERNIDIILTEGGDGNFIRQMYRRASDFSFHSFTLGREEGLRKSYSSKSYTTYGRVMYKPSPAMLKGRIHIDVNTSFLFLESGICGLAEVSRLSLIGLQQMARLSPGTAISSMETTEALKRSVAVPWKKNRPEDFKKATELMVSDRGGFIFTPRVGFHTGVYGVDFSSLYPSIMVAENISVDTLNCGCCRAISERVPGLSYHFCRKRKGIVPAVADMLIARRRHYKRTGGEEATDRSNALKWVLVTSFGYTGYRNAKFGSIECHESINAYGREILLKTVRIAEELNFSVLHGIVDSLWVRGKGDINAFAERVEEETGIPLCMEGMYRWIVFLANKGNGEGSLNRYYGEFEDGGMKLRGIEVRRSDTPGLVRFAQSVLLEKLRGASDMGDFLSRASEGVLEIKEIVRNVERGKYPLEELVITRRVSKNVDEYVTENEQKLALAALRLRGIDRHAGEAVRFIIATAGGRNRVVPEQFFSSGEIYDVSYYTRLVARAVSTLLSPFGYTEEKVISAFKRS